MLAYINLDTPFNPGNYDPDGYTYPHCYITLTVINSRDKIIKLCVEYGTMVSSDGYDGYDYSWEKGAASKDEVFFVADQEDYDDIILSSNSPVTAHQWILDNSGIVGTVINIE